MCRQHNLVEQNGHIVIGIFRKLVKGKLIKWVGKLSFQKAYLDISTLQHKNWLLWDWELATVVHVIES